MRDMLQLAVLIAAVLAPGAARADAKAEHDRQVDATRLAAALLDYRTGDYAAASDGLARLLQKPEFAQDGQLWLLQARSANRSGRPMVALDAVERARERGAPAAVADYEAGVAHVMTEDFAQAADLLERALLAGSREEGLLYHLTLSYAMLGRRNEVREINRLAQSNRTMNDLRDAMHRADVADTARSLPSLEALTPAR